MLYLGRLALGFATISLASCFYMNDLPQNGGLRRSQVPPLGPSDLQIGSFNRNRRAVPRAAYRLYEREAEPEENNFYTREAFLEEPSVWTRDAEPEDYELFVRGADFAEPNFYARDAEPQELGLYARDAKPLRNWYKARQSIQRRHFDDLFFKRAALGLPLRTRSRGKTPATKGASSANKATERKSTTESKKATEGPVRKTSSASAKTRPPVAKNAHAATEKRPTVKGSVAKAAAHVGAAAKAIAPAKHEQAHESPFGHFLGGVGKDVNQGLKDVGQEAQVVGKVAGQVGHASQQVGTAAMQVEQAAGQVGKAVDQVGKVMGKVAPVAEKVASVAEEAAPIVEDVAEVAAIF